MEVLFNIKLIKKSVLRLNNEIPNHFPKIMRINRLPLKELPLVSFGDVEGSLDFTSFCAAFLKSLLTAGSVGSLEESAGLHKEL